MFVVDTSGSMEKEERLALVTQGLRMLCDALEQDAPVATLRVRWEGR